MTGFATLLIDDHEFIYPTDPPPNDPVDVEDLPPADLDACEHCSGLGLLVVGLDEAERPIDEPCTWCDGSGDRRGWAGAA